MAVVRKVFLTLLLMVSLCTLTSLANAYNAYINWTVVTVPGTATMLMPPTMELQSEGYKERSGTSYLDKGNYNRLCMQQQGLNAGLLSAFSKYARVVFTTKLVPDVPALGEPLSLNSSETQYIYQTFTRQYPLRWGTHLTRLLYMAPLKITNVNGIDCLYLYYLTQLDNKPFVINQNYIFFNKDRMHNLLTMYRSTEANYWTAPGFDIRNVINTLTVIKSSGSYTPKDA